MLRYYATRVRTMLVTLFAISVLVFLIIELPPGDFLSSTIAELESQGETEQTLERIAFLRDYYGLDKPPHERYLQWIGGLLRGDMGYSLRHEQPVGEVIGDRIYLTITVNFTVILFTYAISFPIGVYSATHQYSLGDYTFTLIGNLGLAIPNFLLALVLMYFAMEWRGIEIGGLMDDAYKDAPWTWDKVVSVLEHMIIPVIVIGTAGTAAMIRRLRANLLDELQKQYVVTARAKGLPPARVLVKYPLRMSLNPFIADIGNLLPQVVSGSVIIAVVLDLQTVGPVLLDALRVQDMHLAGSFLMFLSVLTVIGMLVSDLALAALDPRIRLGASR